MSIWSNFEYTGGPWPIRSVIRVLVEETVVDGHFLSDSKTSSIVFTAIEKAIEDISNNRHEYKEFVTMFNAIDHYCQL